jgi:Domain of unknown function (DUF4410)
MTRCCRLGFGTLAALVLASCAAAHVTGSVAQGQKVAAPKAIYYTPLDTSTGSWKAQSASLTKLRTNVADWYIKILPESLGRIAPTTQYTGNETDGWLVKAQVDHVDPGSAALRYFVGYGAGQSKIECTFTVVDLARAGTPFVVVRTEGDSGMQSENLFGANGPRADLGRVLSKLRDYLVSIIQ